MRISLLATALLLVELRPADAADHRVQDVAGLRRAMGAAKPGDRILLAAGDYPGNHFFQNLHGSATKPIVIAAANADRPPRLVGDAICLQLSSVSHLELKDLVFTGAKDNALNIDDAGKPDKPSHHVTLRNIRVTDVMPGFVDTPMVHAQTYRPKSQDRLGVKTTADQVAHVVWDAVHGDKVHWTTKLDLAILVRLSGLTGLARTVMRRLMT